jgi:hypothetical protein
LKTTDETVEYFTKHLYSGAAAARLAKLAGHSYFGGAQCPSPPVGIVFDICHQAVEYENISESLQKLVDAGIPVFKLQEAAALYVPRVTQKSIDVLQRYAQTIYLTQTIEKKDGQFSKFLNLEDAFATGATAQKRENGGHTFMFPFSWMILALSARRGLPSRTRCGSTKPTRSRDNWKSKPTPGMFFQTA